MEELTKHYLISGRVQGVGYRRFAQSRANELGLSGWVRNLNDGRVEAIARGPENDLLRLETYLRSGPAHGYVESLMISSIQTFAKCQGFEVRKDGAEPWPEK
jgi:acylphosphatase